MRLRLHFWHVGRTGVAARAQIQFGGFRVSIADKAGSKGESKNVHETEALKIESGSGVRRVSSGQTWSCTVWAAAAAV